MKALLYITIALGLFFSACKGDREDELLNANNTPSMRISKDGGSTYETLIEDSVKISLKSERQRLRVRIQANDIDDNIQTLTYEFTVGSGQVYQDGNAVESIDFNKEIIVIEIAPEELGEVRLQLNLTDEFGGTAQASIYMTTFLNLPPVPVLPQNSLTKLAVNDELEYEMDASQSFDRDDQLGGGIDLYEYTFEGTTIKEERSKIPYIFKEKGNTSISLRVRDTDGIWSERITKTYTIN